jgi:hypothetical protein
VTVALAAALWTAASRPADMATLLVVIGLGMVTHAFPVRSFRHQAYQATLPVIVLAAVTFNTAQLCGFIVLIHIAEQLRVRRSWYIQLFNVADYTVGALVAGLVYRAGIALTGPQSNLAAQLEAALAAGVAFLLVNRALLGGMLWLARGLSLSRSGLFNAELLAADLCITWVCVPMLVLASVAPWMVLAGAAPLYLARPALSYLLAEASTDRRMKHQPASAA